MRSNYRRIGDFIELVDERNKDLKIDRLLGLSITKEFIPSVANTVGTNMKNYKIIRKNQFACSIMQVRRDKKMPVAILKDYDEAIISQAYPVFRVVDESKLLPDYLMMWMSREEFDREACFLAVGGVRGSLEWEDFLNMELPVPSIEKQRELVAEYNAVVDRIELNEQLIHKLEETAQVVFENVFNQKRVEDGKEVKLGDLIEVRGGYSYKSKELEEGEAHLLGMGCISYSKRFLNEGMRLYSEDVPDKHIVKPKDIIIATRQQSKTEPILGYPAMIPSDLNGEKLIVATNLYRVINNSILDNLVLYQLLRSPDYRENIKLNTKGTTVGMITKDAVEDFKFKLPKKEKIDQLRECLESIVELIFLKRSENQNLSNTVSILLTKLSKPKVVALNEIL